MKGCIKVKGHPLLLSLMALVPLPSVAASGIVEYGCFKGENGMKSIEIVVDYDKNNVNFKSIWIGGFKKSWSAELDHAGPDTNAQKNLQKKSITIRTTAHKEAYSKDPLYLADKKSVMTIRLFNGTGSISNAWLESDNNQLIYANLFNLSFCTRTSI
ncbi:hypothetical protein QF117_14225 [Vibrio sp. YMD68]|uniref:hypothetical protein n=1 Tax=Vibrio sp. YMD68 TaxID=3042300 RepID=UPI00249B9BC5|nr:hypothetical protein [Vibrio sp. YMD68]WGV99105.1 hypothetical protein QF117_14225 [Vibrio sp. YMD68]